MVCCWTKCVRARSVLMNMNRRRLLVFLIDSRQTNGCVQLAVLLSSKSIVARWPVFPKKEKNICFEVLRAQTTVGFGSFWNTHTVSRLLFPFRRVRIDPWFVTYYNLYTFFEGPRLYFLSFCQIMWIPTRTSILVELLPKAVSISQCVAWRSSIISFYTASLFSGNNLFSTTFTTFVAERISAIIKLVIPALHSGKRWDFIAKSVSKLIDALLSW